MACNSSCVQRSECVSRSQFYNRSHRVILRHGCLVIVCVCVFVCFCCRCVTHNCRRTATGHIFRRTIRSSVNLCCWLRYSSLCLIFSRFSFILIIISENPYTLALYAVHPYTPCFILIIHSTNWRIRTVSCFSYHTHITSYAISCDTVFQPAKIFITHENTMSKFHMNNIRASFACQSVFWLAVSGISLTVKDGLCASVQHTEDIINIVWLSWRAGLRPLLLPLQFANIFCSFMRNGILAW